MSDIPELIGRFPIIDTLGVGGMGVVYLAKDPDIGRKVAIKVLHSIEDQEALERFKNEARTIGEISHPNIVILLEYGVDNKKPFLVMEYLPGQPLDDWIQKDHTLQEHKSILLDLCSALSFAHSKNILHRDLKQGNIQILPTGQAKLLDFGIASSQDSGLTATGFFIGTPKYLAPEILQDTTHTQASDCYSLALLAYTMFSANNPFSADNFEATMARLLTKKPVSLHKLNPNIPLDLSNTIDAYLEKDPNKRPKTVEKLKFSLELIIKPTVLKKLIVPCGNSDQFNAQETTLLLGQANKNNTKWLAILASSVALFSIGFISLNYYKNQQIEKQNAKQISINEKQKLPKIDNKRSSEPVEKQNSKTADNQTKREELLSQEVNNSSKQNIKPIQEKEKTETVAKKSASVPVENKPKIKKIVTPIKQNKAIKTPSKEPVADKNKPKKDTNKIAETERKNEREKIVVQEPIKKQPIHTIQLPQLSPNTKKIRLTTESDTRVSRGKTKALLIKTPSHIEIEEFVVMRGRSRSSQVEIRTIKKISNDLTQVILYAQSNSQLGVISLVGIYQSKKTKPLNLEVTL